MVEVRLHGALAVHFGKKWMLDIASPIEAVHAIEANKPGLRKLIRDLSLKGMVFRVRSAKHDYDENDINVRLGSVKRIDIIPIVRGAGPGVRFVIGAVLVVVGYFVPGAQALIPVGLSLMIGAVTEWLTPVPKKDEATKDKESWTLNGPSNLAEQGYPVPVVYGEVLTGGYPISAGISASQVNSGGTIDPVVEVTGNQHPFNDVRRRAIGGGGGIDTWSLPIELRLSAAPFNLSEPFTYDWSYTLTPADAVNTTWSVSSFVDGEATMVLRGVIGASAFTSVFPGDGGPPSVRLTGTVTLTMTGREMDRSTTGAPVTLTRSVTVPVSLTARYDIFDFGS